MDLDYVMGIKAYIKNNIDEFVLLIVLGVVSIPIGFDVFKYVFLSLIFVIWISCKWQKESVLRFNGPAILLLLFAFLCFLSGLWAIDPTQSSSSGFSWLFMTLVVMISSQWKVTNKINKTFLRLLILMFLIGLILHLFAVHFEMSFNGEWNAFLAKNRYYTTSYLVVLFPFLLFYQSKNQLVRFIKIASILLLFNLITITGARGALVALGVVLAFKLWSIYNARVIGYAVLTIGILITVYFAFGDEIHSVVGDTQIVKDYSLQKEDRHYLNQVSFDLYKRNKLLGVGAGNWLSNAYTIPVTHDSEFNLKENLFHLTSHNLFTQILAELGTVGFLLFLTIIGYAVMMYIGRRPNEINSFYYIPLTCLMVYLTLSIFYKSANSNDGFLSGIQIIGMVSLGIMLNGAKDMSINKWLKVVLLGCAIISLFWFINNCIVTSFYLKFKNNPEEYHETLVNIEAMGIKNRINDQSLIAEHLAEYYLQSEPDKGKKYLNKSKEVAPHSLSIKMMEVLSNQDQKNQYRLLDEILTIQPMYRSAIDLKEALKR